MKKTFGATGPFTFDVGTANGYSPVTVNVTAGTFPSDLTVKAFQGPQPNFPVPAKALSRYWTLNGTGITADLTFSYLDPTDIPGTATEANFVIQKYDGMFTQPGGTVDTTANTASISGVTSFSDWTLAESGDISPPLITYSSFGTTGSTANRVLSVTILDDVNVASGAVAPRIYFRKNAGTYFSTPCVLTSGDTQAGNYDCTIDNSLMGGVAAGDTIGYFVIAQDTSGNVASNPSGAVAANVNTVTTPPTANTYTLLQTFAGSVSVGTDQPIQSLTNNGGLFELMNAGTISGNTVVNITTDLTAETGSHSLNQLIEEGAGNWTIFFQASDGPRIISGSNATALINLNGADRVTFSGLAFGPLGMTIRNLGNGATIRMENDASNNSILNCIVEGGNANANSGVVTLGLGTTTGNDNNSISDCHIRDRSDAVGIPANLIFSLGANSNTVIANNQLFNYTRAGISSSGADNLTISGNTVFQTGSRTTPILAFEISSTSGTNTISQNIIRDHTTSAWFAGIGLYYNNGTFMLSGNRVYNIDGSPGGSGVLNAVDISNTNPASSISLVNNMFSMVPATSTLHFVHGVFDLSGVGSLDLTHNTILIGGTTTGSSTSSAFLRRTGTTTTVSLTGNIFFNNRTGGGVDHFAVADQSAGAGSWSSNYNIFVGTGTTLANFFDFGTTAFPGTPVDFAAWQAGPPTRDANSFASIAGAGPFNVGNMFVSTSDLHLKLSSNNPAINTGTSTGTTTDFDGQTRPFNGTPDIGADEVQTVPTAAEVSLSGRVTNPNGQGIRNIRVVISGGSLSEPRLATTGSFGYFSFDGLEAGETYVVTVSGKRFVFVNPSRVVTLVDSLADVDFVGRPR